MPPLTTAERSRRSRRLRAKRQAGNLSIKGEDICLCEVEEITPVLCKQLILESRVMKRQISSVDRNRLSRASKRLRLVDSALENHSNQQLDDRALEQDLERVYPTLASSIQQDVNRDPKFAEYWNAASVHFDLKFVKNTFGHHCDVCDRIWFHDDLKLVPKKHCSVLEPIFGSESCRFLICNTCYDLVRKGRFPVWSKTNGFAYPDKPDNLPKLNPITTRLISPRIMFMSIRRLVRDGSLGIIGQVINVPIDVNSMVQKLPRQLDDDHVINVALKRKLFHKSTFLEGYVKKRDLKLWLEYLVDKPLYRHYNIEIDWNALEEIGTKACDTSSLIDDCNDDLIENISCSQDELAAPLLARQQTMMWSESSCIEIAPHYRQKPINIIFDHHAEELAFPAIYYGHARKFNPNVKVTPYMIASSEIRRRDRRGATPEHILFMAMKILRLRIVDNIRSTFRRVAQTENITRKMIEDKRFLEECVEKNLAFLKSLPNSCQYWMSRKNDLFAMIRQLGKPTAFMTLSANELNWPNLLKVLHKLSDLDSLCFDNPVEDLCRSIRAHLVNEDPVTCCAYFSKLVDVIMNMLTSKHKYNPFGRYRVLDFFQRIEFQHRGSPHAHILLWLDNDPKEPISENMPGTIQMATDLISVSSYDLDESKYINQIHHHTFTCTKRGESSCRFNIPFWPVARSVILLPLAKDDDRKCLLSRRAKDAKRLLNEKKYVSLDSFLLDCRIESYSIYLDIIRSTLIRPALLLKRSTTETMVNSFNPWIAQTMSSNMDLQIILDEYSCANYVAEYVNKSNRGISQLHRELIKLTTEHPEMDQDQLLRRIGLRVLNSVEMSSQEAAWYLLRLSMSHASREVLFIPTCWPAERFKSFKRRIDLAKLELDSTDVWTKNLVQKYELRPAELDNYCLAEFAANYKSNKRNEFADANDTHTFSKRTYERVIRYVNYDSNDVDNYKREMVLLFVPFRNEQVDILDRNKYVEIFSAKLDEILAMRSKYEIITNIEQLAEELNSARSKALSDDSICESAEYRDKFVKNVALLEGEEEDFADFGSRTDRTENSAAASLSRIRQRDNIMSKAEYCRQMCTTNKRQRELILEVLHRLTASAIDDCQPLQIFFTGPAGCGKTYVLKLIMETYNRFSEETSVTQNAYLACASTGKAAVNLGGTTVHSAFHLTPSRNSGAISQESLHKLRSSFKNVGCIIVDEISMIGSSLFHQINERLQHITGELEQPFGGLPIIFCGDFRQLPPVMSTPVYKASRSHIRGNLLWQMMDYFQLTQVMRQTDKLFSTILTKIGNGLQLDAEESKIIESRFRTDEWCDSNLSGTIRLFHQNQDVDAYNYKILEDGLDYVANDVISGHSTNEQLSIARTKLHKFSTMESNGLSYHIMLKLGQPYMITINIDTDDGLVNGLIGTLRHYDECPSIEDRTTMMVWLEFESIKIGAQARSKIRASNGTARKTSEDNPSWVPLYERSSKINLGGSIRCRRTQLPIAAACAITIHKSQGGTFKTAVVAYDKNQTNQLVYVALSRLESLEGLYLTNIRGDFTFYHKYGCSAPSIKEIRDEYERLAQHPVSTLTQQIDKFILDARTNNEEPTLIVGTINAQSLWAHSRDIESDYILSQSNLLAITETWLSDDCPQETLDGFELITGLGTNSNGRNTESTRRQAGGVAIYKKIVSYSEFDSVSIIKDSLRKLEIPGHGECASIDLRLHYSGEYILWTMCVVYLHPNLSKASIMDFIRQSMDLYDTSQHSKLFITGDFNCNIADDNWLVDFMAKSYALDYVETSKPTTLGKTIIDLSFVKNMRAESRPFVAYFSYHRPIVTRLELLH